MNFSDAAVFSTRMGDHVMNSLRGWAVGKGPRWMTQQIVRALTVALLTMTVTATSDTVSQGLYIAVTVAITLDAMCLWTGTVSSAEAARENLYRAAARAEAVTGRPVAYGRNLADVVYQEARFQGFGVACVYFFTQTFIGLPIAFTAVHDTTTLAVLILARELVVRLGPFTVPAANVARS